jgi:hypothetical protein
MGGGGAHDDSGNREKQGEGDFKKRNVIEKKHGKTTYRRETADVSLEENSDEQMYSEDLDVSDSEMEEDKRKGKKLRGGREKSLRDGKKRKKERERKKEMKPSKGGSKGGGYTIKSHKGVSTKEDVSHRSGRDHPHDYSHKERMGRGRSWKGKKGYENNNSDYDSEDDRYGSDGSDEDIRRYNHRGRYKDDRYNRRKGYESVSSSDATMGTEESTIMSSEEERKNIRHRQKHVWRGGGYREEEHKRKSHQKREGKRQKRKHSYSNEDWASSSSEEDEELGHGHSGKQNKKTKHHWKSKERKEHGHHSHRKKGYHEEGEERHTRKKYNNNNNRQRGGYDDDDDSSDDYSGNERETKQKRRDRIVQNRNSRGGGTHFTNINNSNQKTQDFMLRDHHIRGGMSVVPLNQFVPILMNPQQQQQQQQKQQQQKIVGSKFFPNGFPAFITGKGSKSFQSNNGFGGMGNQLKYENQLSSIQNGKSINTQPPFLVNLSGYSPRSDNSSDLPNNYVYPELIQRNLFMDGDNNIPIKRNFQHNTGVSDDSTISSSTTARMSSASSPSTNCSYDRTSSPFTLPFSDARHRLHVYSRGRPHKESGGNLVEVDNRTIQQFFGQLNIVNEKSQDEKRGNEKRLNEKVDQITPVQKDGDSSRFTSKPQIIIKKDEIIERENLLSTSSSPFSNHTSSLVNSTTNAKNRLGCGEFSSKLSGINSGENQKSDSSSSGHDNMKDISQRNCNPPGLKIQNNISQHQHSHQAVGERNCGGDQKSIISENSSGSDSYVRNTQVTDSTLSSSFYRSSHINDESSFFSSNNSKKVIHNFLLEKKRKNTGDSDGDVPDGRYQRRWRRKGGRGGNRYYQSVYDDDRLTSLSESSKHRKNKSLGDYIFANPRFSHLRTATGSLNSAGGISTMSILTGLSAAAPSLSVKTETGTSMSGNDDHRFSVSHSGGGDANSSSQSSPPSELVFSEIPTLSGLTVHSTVDGGHIVASTNSSQLPSTLPLTLSVTSRQKQREKGRSSTSDTVDDRKEKKNVEEDDVDEDDDGENEEDEGSNEKEVYKKSEDESESDEEEYHKRKNPHSRNIQPKRNHHSRDNNRHHYHSSRNKDYSKRGYEKRGYRRGSVDERRKEKWDDEEDEVLERLKKESLKMRKKGRSKEKGMENAKKKLLKIKKKNLEKKHIRPLTLHEFDPNNPQLETIESKSTIALLAQAAALGVSPIVTRTNSKANSLMKILRGKEKGTSSFTNIDERIKRDFSQEWVKDDDQTREKDSLASAGSDNRYNKSNRSLAALSLSQNSSLANGFNNVFDNRNKSTRHRQRMENLDSSNPHNIPSLTSSLPLRLPSYSSSSLSTVFGQNPQMTSRSTSHLPLIITPQSSQSLPFTSSHNPSHLSLLQINPSLPGQPLPQPVHLVKKSSGGKRMRFGGMSEGKLKKDLYPNSGSFVEDDNNRLIKSFGSLEMMTDKNNVMGVIMTSPSSTTSSSSQSAAIGSINHNVTDLNIPNTGLINTEKTNSLTSLDLPWDGSKTLAEMGFGGNAVFEKKESENKNRVVVLNGEIKEKEEKIVDEKSLNKDVDEKKVEDNLESKKEENKVLEST